LHLPDEHVVSWTFQMNIDKHEHLVMIDAHVLMIDVHVVMIEYAVIIDEHVVRWSQISLV
jgi:hypothetical protein